MIGNTAIECDDIGVGAADAVSIEVTWPDGAVELFEDVCAPCRIRITR